MQEQLHDFPVGQKMLELPNELWEYILYKMSREDREHFVWAFLQLNHAFHDNGIKRNFVGKILVESFFLRNYSEYIDKFYHALFQAEDEQQIIEDNDFDVSDELNQVMLSILTYPRGSNFFKTIFGKIYKDSADIFEILINSPTSKRWRDLIPQEAQDEKSERLLSTLVNIDPCFMIFCISSLCFAEKSELELKTLVRMIGKYLYHLLRDYLSSMNEDETPRFMLEIFFGRPMVSNLDLYLEKLETELFNYTSPNAPMMSQPCSEFVHTLKKVKEKMNTENVEPYTLVIGFLLHLSLLREDPDLTRETFLQEALQVKPVMNHFEQGFILYLGYCAIYGLYRIFIQDGAADMFLNIAFLSISSFALYMAHQKIDKRKIARETGRKMAEKIEEMIPTDLITSESGVRIEVPRLSFFNQERNREYGKVVEIEEREDIFYSLSSSSESGD